MRSWRFTAGPDHREPAGSNHAPISSKHSAGACIGAGCFAADVRCAPLPHDLQVPHFTKDLAAKAAGAGVESIFDLVEMEVRGFYWVFSCASEEGSVAVCLPCNWPGGDGGASPIVCSAKSSCSPAGLPCSRSRSFAFIPLRCSWTQSATNLIFWGW